MSSKTIQTYLKKLGYYMGEIDGVIGKKSISARGGSFPNNEIWKIVYLFYLVLYSDFFVVGLAAADFAVAVVYHPFFAVVASAATSF